MPSLKTFARGLITCLADLRLALRSDFFFLGLAAVLVESFSDGPRLRDARYWLFARIVWHVLQLAGRG